MVNQKSPSSADSTYMKKIRKPLVEKRRRDRMNHSLEQLKTLLAVKIKQSNSSSTSRLDKADILEMTVSHLTTLQDQHRSVTLATTVEGYKKGFKDCARETFNYLSSTRAIDNKSLQRLNTHIQTSYLQKTQQRRAVSGHRNPQTAEVTYVHDTPRQDIQATDEYSYTSSYHPSALTQFHNSALRGLSVSNLYGQSHSGKNTCAMLNDSADTSLNSSANMSLDSSSSITPEKIVPGQSSAEDVWRPW